MSETQTIKRRAVVVMAYVPSGILDKSVSEKHQQDSRPEMFTNKNTDNRRVRDKVMECLRRGKNAGSKALELKMPYFGAM